MLPAAQHHLVRLLEDMRRLRRQRLDEAVSSRLAHAGGTMEALRAVGAVTDDEFGDWMNRFLVAAGIEPPPETQGHVSAVAVPVGSPKQPPTVPSASLPRVARFERLVPGPSEDKSFFGGRLRIIAVELYDSTVVVQWRMAPLPELEPLFGDDMAAGERDTEGLPEPERQRHRQNVRLDLHHHLPQRMTLGDDLGTAYSSRGTGSSGDGMELVGRHIFEPGVPSNATRLEVRAGDTAFTIQLD